MEKNSKILVLEEDDAHQLWDAIKADKEEQFFKLDYNPFPVILPYTNFIKVAHNIWVGMDMASPELDETYVFKFCCNSGKYTLELESYKRGN